MPRPPIHPRSHKVYRSESFHFIGIDLPAERGPRPGWLRLYLCYAKEGRRHTQWPSSLLGETTALDQIREPQRMKRLSDQDFEHGKPILRRLGRRKPLVRPATSSKDSFFPWKSTRIQTGSSNCQSECRVLGVGQNEEGRSASPTQVPYLGNFMEV